MKINPIAPEENLAVGGTVLKHRDQPTSKKDSGRDVKLIRPISEIKERIRKQTEVLKLNESNLYSGAGSPAQRKPKQKANNFMRER